MKLSIWVITCALFIGLITPNALNGQSTWRVDSAASGGNTGLNWPDAFISLDAALDTAAIGDSIFVAEGTYYPLLDSGFQLKDEIKLFGGFPRGGSGFTGRDWQNYKTILSGDRDLNQTPSAGDAFHVLFGRGVTVETIVDGFTMARGHSKGILPHNMGGAILIISSSPKLRNLSLEDNVALSGGGIAMINCSPLMNNIDFLRNEGPTGGGIYALGGRPKLSYGNLVDNFGVEGGGMYLDNTFMEMDHILFSKNIATNGGGIFIFDATPQITEIVIDSNTATLGGGIYHDGGSALFRELTLSNNVAFTQGGGFFNNRGNPNVINCRFSNNSANQGGAWYHAADGASLFNGTFYKNSTPNNGGALYTFAGSLSLTNCSFNSNFSSSGGALFNAGALPILTNCILWGNGTEVVDAGVNPTTATNCDIAGGWTGQGTGNISIAPRFRDTLRGDLHLEYCSSIIDLGTPTISLDLDNFPRPVDGDGDTLAHWDMGAFEVQVPIVTSSGRPSFCTGDSVIIFTPDTANTYQWYHNGAMIQGAIEDSLIVTLPGVYNLAITLTNCLRVPTGGITVLEIPLPVVNLGMDTSSCGSYLLNPGFDTTYSFLWPGLVTDPTLTVNNSGTYWVNVTDTNFCMGTDSAVIQILSPVAVHLGGDTSICPSDLFPLDADPLGTGQQNLYLWSTGETSSSIMAPPGNGYSVTVTTPNGCEDTDSVSIISLPAPSLNLGQDLNLCTGNSVTLDAGPLGTNYAWSSGDSTQTLTVSTGGTWSVIKTGTNGCQSWDTLTITPVTLPVANLGPDTSVCGDSLTLWPGPAIPGATYTWSPPSSDTALTINIGGTYSVHISSAPGCEDSDTINVIISLPPLLNIGGDTAHACDGDTLLLDGGPVNPGDSFLWSDNSTASTWSTSSSGTFWVRKTNQFQCVNSDTLTAVFHPLPPLGLGNDTSFCDGGSVLLDAGGGNYSYLWSDSSQNQTLLVTTTGNWSVVKTTPFYCEAYDTLRVIVKVQPVIDLGTNDTLCNGDSLDLDADPGNVYHGATYVWSSGDSNRISTIGSTGMYWVQLTTFEGCTDSDSVIVVAYSSPQASISIDSSLCPQFNFTGGAGGTAGTSWNWDFGDGNGSSTQQNDLYTYSQNGLFDVSLRVANQCGSDTARQSLPVTCVPDGIIDGIPEDLVSLFPNPSSTSFILRIEKYFANNMEMRLFDGAGKEVLHFTEGSVLGQGEWKYDISNFPAGVYYLKLELDGKSLGRLLIKAD